MMISTYLHREIRREGVPFPSPSSAPQAVTDREDTIKPMLMIRRADFPARMVSAFDVNIPIREPGTARQTTVPQNHDHTCHGKSNHVYLSDSFLFSGAVIITDHRPHSLDDPACWKIKESLHLIIDPKNDYIALRINSKNAVQNRDQKRGKSQVQDCRIQPNKVFYSWKDPASDDSFSFRRT